MWVLIIFSYIPNTIHQLISMYDSVRFCTSYGNETGLTWLSTFGNVAYRQNNFMWVLLFFPGVTTHHWGRQTALALVYLHITTACIPSSTLHPLSASSSSPWKSQAHVPSNAVYAGGSCGGTNSKLTWLLPTKSCVPEIWRSSCLWSCSTGTPSTALIQ